MTAWKFLYKKILYKYPFFIQCTQASILMGVGDVSSQLLVEKKTFTNINLKRTAKFTTIGMCLVGPTITTWYKILNKYVGGTNGIRAVKKMLFDQLLFAPPFLSVLLVSISTIEGNSLNDSINNLKKNYFDVLLNNYKLWPLAQVVNFYIVPLYYQVLFVQCVAVFWNTYISWKTHQEANQKLF